MTDTTRPLLDVQDLTVAYGTLTAVRGVSLYVQPGEIVAVVGPNGAGKTTTLSAVAGLLRPRGGTIAFHGRSIDGEKPEDVVRRGIALVREGRHILTSLTVEENLLLGATCRPDREQVRRSLDEQFSRFPILAERRSQHAGYLSGGEQQQLAIARALMSSPQLLLLDEPSLGLAPRIVDGVFETIVALREDGLSILLVEQNATRAVAMSDRAYVMGTGRVTRSGTPEALGEGGGMAAEYLGLEPEVTP